MRDQTQADITRFRVINELEIRLGFFILRFIANHGAIGAVPFDFDLVTWRINRSEWLLRFHFYFYTQALDRLRGKFLRAQRVAVGHCAGVRTQ